MFTIFEDLPAKLPEGAREEEMEASTDRDCTENPKVHKHPVNHH